MEFAARTADSQVAIVHHVDHRGVWASKGRRVLFASNSGADWTRLCEFPARLPADLMAVGRLPRRLLRSDKCNVYPTRSGRLLGIRRGVVYRMPESPADPADPWFGINGDCVMNRAIAEDADGNLYFGEYFMNPRRSPVRIWRVDADLAHFEVAYSFDPSRTRHVHAVHADPHLPQRLWVTMGDFEDECYLAYTDDRFESIRFLGDGTQLWRMVGIVFQKHRLCWLTDTHVEQNRIVSMDRESERLQIHGQRPASSWYVAKTTDGLHLATTTVEPGPGIHTNKVSLLASEDGLCWNEVTSYLKDPFPMRGFGFGSLALPSGEFSAHEFWISGEGIRGLDGFSQLCSVRYGA